MLCDKRILRLLQYIFCNFIVLQWLVLILEQAPTHTPILIKPRTKYDLLDYRTGY